MDDITSFMIWGLFGLLEIRFCETQRISCELLKRLR